MSTETNWHTPEWLLDLVRQIGAIGLDPATDATNPTKAGATFTPAEDGLSRPWAGRGLVYVNPPYSRGESPMWAEKILAEAKAGAEIVALLPARTDTRWWHDCIAMLADAVCFLRGRPRFIDGDNGGADGAGKFPSAVAYFGDRAKAFRRAFAGVGWIP